MKLEKIAEIKKECKRKQRHTMEGSDCRACPLAGKVNLRLAVESHGVWDEGDIVLPITPCLFLEELLPLIKETKRMI